MDKITIPFHLAIPTLIGICALLTIFVKRHRLFSEQNRKWFWISIIVFFVIYVLIVGSSTIDAIYYQWDLNRYDLDKDGFFGGEELTKEQKDAMFRLTNDVGRNFSFITGIFVSAIISTSVYIMGKLYQKTRQSNI
jgi:hypothetical protein